MRFLHPVHVHVQREVGMGMHGVEPLVQQKAVGAEVDMFFSLEHAVDQIVEIGIEERFSAGNGNDGGRAFIDGMEALLQRHHFLDRIGVLANSAASGTGKIAEVGRLQHQYQGSFLNFLQLVFDDVFRQVVIQLPGKTHEAVLPFHWANAWRSTPSVPVSSGKQGEGVALVILLVPMPARWRCAGGTELLRLLLCLRRRYRDSPAAALAIPARCTDREYRGVSP